MTCKYLRKITPTGTSLTVVIPPALLNEIGLGRGDTVEVALSHGRVLTLTPLDEILKSIPFEQRDKGIIKL